MSMYPEEFRYTKEHEWVKAEGDTGVIGITDHAQHELKGISCKECHPQAYADNPRILLDAYILPRKGAEVMMIPNKDNCVKCHAPKTAKEGGVRHNCTECHQYHHGEQSLQGVGAAKRNAGKLHKIEDFLSIK